MYEIPGPTDDVKTSSIRLTELAEVSYVHAHGLAVSGSVEL